MKILLVEDDDKIRSFVTKGLKEQGFTVDACEDGDTGLHLASSFSYSVILLDIMLPGRDGLSILKKLRDDRSGRNPRPCRYRQGHSRHDGLRGIDRPFYL